MTINSEIQKLDPSALIELFELDATLFGGGVIRFQGQSSGPIIWQGQTYSPWPIRGQGFARTSEQQPSPKLLVGNVDGSISTLCLLFDDLVGAVVTRRRTFKKFLDAENFYGDNVLGAPIPVIGQYAINSGVLSLGRPVGTSGVAFSFPVEAGKSYKLSFDVSDTLCYSRVGNTINGNNVLAQVLHSPGFHNREFTAATTETLYVTFLAAALGASPPSKISALSAREQIGNPEADSTQEFEPEFWYIERKAGESVDSVEFDLNSALEFGNIRLPGRQILANHCPVQWVYRGENCGYIGPPVADIYDNPTTDPELDNCGHRLSSCKLREWPNGVLNFGGFPAAGLVRT